METIQVSGFTDAELAEQRARRRFARKLDRMFGMTVVGGVLLVGAWTMGACVVRVAHGSPAECELIKDADKRNFCRAETQHRRSYCELIKDNDLRHRCRAIVTEKKR